MQIKKLKVKDKWNKDYDRKYNLLTFSKKSKNQILHSTNPFIKGF